LKITGPNIQKGGREKRKPGKERGNVSYSKGKGKMNIIQDSETGHHGGVKRETGHVGFGKEKTLGS